MYYGRYTDEERQEARREMEKIDRLADKAVMAVFGRRQERKARKIAARLERCDLRMLMAMEYTAHDHFRSPSTSVVIQRKINDRIDRITDGEELKKLEEFNRVYGGYSHITDVHIRKRLVALGLRKDI